MPTIRLGSEDGINYFNGLMMEAGYLAGNAFSGTDRSNLNTNMHAAYDSW